MFIVIEGQDGVGKTTFANNLAQGLQRLGIPVHRVSQPTQSWIGKGIRECLRMPQVSREQLALLFAADRLELPQESPGEVLISDRHVLSSMVYQGVLNGMGIEWVEDINKHARIPDLTFLLTSKSATERVQQRGQGQEIYEDPTIQDQVAQQYRELSAKFSTIVVSTDQEISIGGLIQRIQEILVQDLGTVHAL